MSGVSPEARLSDPNRSKDLEAEADRLLHRRKGMSGSEFAGIGMQFSVTIVVFALAGVWLDKRLGTSPWMVLLMVLGGFGIGFRTLYRAGNRKTGQGK